MVKMLLRYGVMNCGICLRTIRRALSAPRNSIVELAEESIVGDDTVTERAVTHRPTSFMMDGTRTGNVGNTLGPSFVQRLASVENVVERRAAMERSDCTDCTAPVVFKTLVKGVNRPTKRSG